MHEQVSPCERDVIREARTLERRTKLAESQLMLTYQPSEADDFKSRPLQLKVPLSDTVAKIEVRASARPGQLSEWEKENIERIFKTMDDFPKTKTVKVDSLTKLFDRMMVDETCLGKVPDITKKEFENLVQTRLKEKKEVSYLKFRLLLDEFPWKVLPKAELQQRSEEMYAEANRLLRFGKDADALTECIKAMSLTRNLEKAI